MAPDDAVVLVVDDDIGFLLSIQAALVSAKMLSPALVSDSGRAMNLVRNHEFKLILLDLIMPGINGMEILKQLKEEYPTIECIILTAVDDVPTAVQAIQYGAYDYVVKPIESEKLIITITRALEKYDLRRELALYGKKQTFDDLKNPWAFREMVAEDEAMALVFHQTEVIAPTDYSVVITGETGTGKEMLARIIHSLSPRSNGPFVAVNMAVFSKGLFEDELFGHAKGAFTGAIGARKGFLDSARGGTIFFDEVTEMEPVLQGKLLRVVEEREFYRLGSTEAKGIDLRIIAATNRDIQEDVRIKRFRSDLFHRLNTCHIHISPLRERKKDVLPMAKFFLEKHARKNNKPIDSIGIDLAEVLLSYLFPGNVRELENIIASSVLVEKGTVLSLSSAIGLQSTASSAAGFKEAPHSLAETEKRHILLVLEFAEGNRTKAAKILGIGLRTLQRKLRTFETESPVPE